MQEASSKLIAWVQLQLRKPDAKEEDLDEDKYTDPCSYFKETFGDGARRAALFDEMKRFLDELIDVPAGPIQTDGPLAAPGARFVQHYTVLLKRLGFDILL